jgi:hypothetical protein
MNSRILALGLFVLTAAVAGVWFTWRPAAPAGGAESSAGTTAPRPADPRPDLARPDGAVKPDARTARAADAIPPPAPAPNVPSGTAAPSVPVDAGAPVSADQVTDDTRVFADKYRELGPEARRAALLVLESVIAERVNSGDLDPEGKNGPSLAELKNEVEWLRTHVEG